MIQEPQQKSSTNILISTKLPQNSQKKKQNTKQILPTQTLSTRITPNIFPNNNNNP